MEASIKDRILKWCRDEDVFREEIEDKGSVFHFRVSAPERAKGTPETLDLSTVDVSQATADNDKIIVSCGISFDPEFTAPMISIPNVDDLIFELNITLESRPESFMIDYDEGILKSIVIVEDIFFDGLTKDRFFLALRGVNKSLMMALWVLRPLIDTLGGDTEKLVFTEETNSEEQEQVGSETAMAEEENASTARFCPACGKENTQNNKFCTNCGASMVEE